MQDNERATDFEATVRRAFARLTCEHLPRAATERGWPVRTPAEFERLLLEHVRDTPRPAAGAPCVVDFVLAVELGERLLSGNLCCTTMTRRMLCNSATGDRRRAEALKALLALLTKP